MFIERRESRSLKVDLSGMPTAKLLAIMAQKLKGSGYGVDPPQGASGDG